MNERLSELQNDTYRTFTSSNSMGTFFTIANALVKNPPLSQRIRTSITRKFVSCNFSMDQLDDLINSNGITVILKIITQPVNTLCISTNYVIKVHFGQVHKVALHDFGSQK